MTKKLSLPTIALAAVGFLCNCAHADTKISQFPRTNALNNLQLIVVADTNTLSTPTNFAILLPDLASWLVNSASGVTQSTSGVSVNNLTVNALIVSNGFQLMSCGFTNLTGTNSTIFGGVQTSVLQLVQFPNATKAAFKVIGGSNSIGDALRIEEYLGNVLFRVPSNGTMIAANFTSPTNTPVDGQVVTATGTGGATTWKTGSGGVTFTNVPGTVTTVSTNFILDASTGNIFDVPLTANAGLIVTNGSNRQRIMVCTHQDGTGNRTAVWLDNKTGTQTNMIKVASITLGGTYGFTTNAWAMDTFTLLFNTGKAGVSNTTNRWALLAESMGVY